MLLSKKVLHRLVFRLILSCPGIVTFYVIYRCLQKSFCNNLMHSKLKSKVIEIQGTLMKLWAFKVSRGHLTKVVKSPIMSPGAEDMENLNNW